MKNVIKKIVLDDKNINKKLNNNIHINYKKKIFNPERLRHFFTSKTHRINKYNPKKLLYPKELMIDTRDISQSLINANRNKFNFVEYRHKKYQKYRTPFKKILSNESYEKNLNYYTQNFNNYEYNNNGENMSLREKIMKIKNKAIKAPISGSMPKLVLTYAHLPHKPIGKTIYSVLALRKNQFTDPFNLSKEKENNSMSKIKQMKFTNYNKSSLANYLENKKNYSKEIDLLNQPYSYISLLNDDYSMSEKIRFQKMMDQLVNVKKCMNENPGQKFEIAKEFILSIGIYKISDFDLEKINNFINFINNGFLIDPSKNIKENIIDILNNKNIDKPPISNNLNCLNEDYLSNEMKKRKKLLKHKKIGEAFNSWAGKRKYINDDLSNINNLKKNNILYIKEGNQSTKHIKTKTTDKKYKPKTLELKGLCIDLKRQQEIELTYKGLDLDIVKNPKVVVDMIENELIKKRKENIGDKKHFNWCGNVYKNKRLYGTKGDNSDYEEIKKKNKLTEYICLVKAKNKLEFDNLRKMYKI